MRPNYALDAPPTVITVGGSDYPVKWDYRVWLEALQLLKKINPDAKTPEGAQATVDALYDLQVLLFGGVLKDENPGDVLRGILDFSKGYPSAPMGSMGDESAQPVISYEYDLNEIILAIRVQYGVDLSYRRTEPFHWWEFLLLFHTLAGPHYILNLTEIRGYKGTDKEMLRRKAACALPVELTAAEQEEWDEFSSQFI